MNNILKFYIISLFFYIFIQCLSEIRYTRLHSLIIATHAIVISLNVMRLKMILELESKRIQIIFLSIFERLFFIFQFTWQSFNPNRTFDAYNRTNHAHSITHTHTYIKCIHAYTWCMFVAAVFRPVRFYGCHCYLFH